MVLIFNFLQYNLFLFTRPILEGGKRSIFLTNTVALAHQQAEVIAKSTPLRVAVYSGDMNVDAWNKEKWFNEFDENQVRLLFSSDPSVSNGL